MFYFFYKIVIFRLDKEKDDILYQARMYSFISFMKLYLESQSYRSEIKAIHFLKFCDPSIGYTVFITLWKHICWPIKMGVLYKYIIL